MVHSLPEAFARLNACPERLLSRSQGAVSVAAPADRDRGDGPRKDRQDRLADAQRRHGRGGFLTGGIGLRVSAVVFL